MYNRKERPQVNKKLLVAIEEELNVQTLRRKADSISSHAAGGATVVETQKNTSPEKMTNAMAEKLYIVVAGAIASGKTTLALNLARLFKDCFYFDKDDLGPMAEEIFFVGEQEEYDRQSDFFKTYVRDVEYVVAETAGLRGFLFNDHVIINTPYTSEIRTEFDGKESKGFKALCEEVHARGGRLMVIYIDIDRALVKERLEKRRREDPNATLRTPRVYEDIDKFLDGQNLSVKEGETVRSADYFFVFRAANPPQSFEELKAYMNVSGDPYNETISRERFMEAPALRHPERFGIEAKK